MRTKWNNGLIYHNEKSGPDHGIQHEAIIGVASLTAIGVYLDRIGFVLSGLAVLFFGYGWYTKRKKAKAIGASSCDSNCQCNAESTASN